MYPFKKFSLSLIMLLIGMASIGVQHGWCASGPPPLDLTKAEPASSSGVVRSPGVTVGIGGVVYEGFISSRAVSGFFITWRVPSGYSVFDAYVGMGDTGQTSEQATFRLLVDGDEVKRSVVSWKRKAEHWSIKVSGGQSVSIEVEKKLGTPVIAQPKFLAGAVVETPKPAPSTSTVSTASSGTPSGAPFAVDPNDMDKLATALRAAVDAKPALKTKVDNGNVALVSFTLVDIASQSVATNVAEDLYTAMIKRDFPLVERGQLDKILKELKIQDTGLIDPSTAQKIGQLSGCNIIVVGSISDRGTFVVINSRLLDTATGKALTAERVEMRKVPISR